MTSAIRRIVCAAILAFCVVGAAVNVAQAADRSGHACCHRTPARSSAAPDSPCDGFMPLTCCRAAALPGASASAPAPSALALFHSVALVAPVRVVATRPVPAVLAPRIAATHLSVVLLV